MAVHLIGNEYKALGAEMKLSGRTVVFTPVKYLIPIKNAVSNTPSISESGRTRPEQGSDTANSSTSFEWWGLQGVIFFAKAKNIPAGRRLGKSKTSFRFSLVSYCVRTYGSRPINIVRN